MEGHLCFSAPPKEWLATLRSSPSKRARSFVLFVIVLLSASLASGIEQLSKGRQATQSSFLPIRRLRHRDDIDSSPLVATKATRDSYHGIAAGCDLECCSLHYQDDNERLMTECKDEDDGGGWVSKLPTPVQMILIVFLVCMSGLFSGLTLGLMSLDKTGLEIVMGGDDPALARAAQRIYPVRSNGNLLLCTLLLGNVAVNSLLSILSSDIFGGTVGFVSSTAVIVIFGEIIPQAACSRYALQIGSKTVPLVKVIMCIFYPAAAPLAWALNKALGHEIGTVYSKAEMLKLLEIHVSEGAFDKQVGTAMTGALKYQDVTVKEVMTPLENTFMLSVDEKLSFETIATIFKTGYSRIPVYEVSVNNIIGLLFVKDLIFIDPEDETPVRNFVQIFGRGVHVVWPDDKLGTVLAELKQGRSHMALVRDVNNEDDEQDPFYEIKGIITLEDIIEVILGDEIVDETDAFVDQTHSIKVNRMEDFDWGRLRLLDTKIVDEVLSHDEVKAVTAHLRTNHSSAVSLLSDKQLFRLVAETSVTELPTAEQNVGQDMPTDLMYQKGVPTDVCTLILSGKVTVLAGEDNFRSDVSSWSVLAASAITSSTYAPDFSAFVSNGPCRCLRFTRDLFTAAVDASALEKLASGEHEAVVDDASPGASGDAQVANKSKEAEQAAAGISSLESRSLSHISDSSSLDKHHAKDRHTVLSRRSKLLAAFQKATENTSAKQQKLKDMAESSTTEDSKREDAESQNSDPEKKKSVSFGNSEAPAAVLPSTPGDMISLRQQLTDGGTYAPKPSHAAQSESSESVSQSKGRIQTSALEYIDSDPPVL